MKNILCDRENKMQSELKLVLALDNLYGVSQGLSFYEQPKLKRAIQLIEEVRSDLKKELSKLRDKK